MWSATAIGGNRFDFSYSPRSTTAGHRGISAREGRNRGVRAARALAERERQFAALVENLPDIVFRLDIDLRHLYISSQIEQLIAIPQKEFIGRTLIEAGVPMEWSEPIERACRRALKTGKRVSTACRTTGANCAPEWCPSATTTAIGFVARHQRRRDRNRNGHLCVCASAKGRCGRLTAARMSFSQCRAPELRNPLARISQRSEILWLMSFDPERVRETSEIIVRQARHMTRSSTICLTCRELLAAVDARAEAIDLRSVTRPLSSNRCR